MGNGKWEMKKEEWTMETKKRRMGIENENREWQEPIMGSWEWRMGIGK